MSARTPAIPRDLPDGVYLDLDPLIYFAQPRMGSSDMMRLHRRKEGWWWSSPFNPDHVDDGDTGARNYGSALHTILLEGLRIYEGRHMVEPDITRYADPLVTIADIKKALAGAGVKLRGVSDYSKDDWVQAAVAHLPNRHVWDKIIEDFERRRIIQVLGDGTVVKRPKITAEEDRMLRVMHDAAMEDADIRMLLMGAEEIPALAELSFFWTDEYGLQRRARFDKPVPTFTLDLKSLGNWEGRELAHAVGDTIQREAYDVQLADQHDARLRMHHMIRAAGERCIAGGTIDQRAWLLAIAERNLPFDWRWLFYQKPEAKGRAPIIFPVAETWGGPYHRSGYRKLIRARANFLGWVDKFGLGETPDAMGRPSRPWTRIEPLHHVQAVERHPDLPVITLPTWGWQETPVDGEEDHFARRFALLA